MRWKRKSTVRYLARAALPGIFTLSTLPWFASAVGAIHPSPTARVVALSTPGFGAGQANLPTNAAAEHAGRAAAATAQRDFARAENEWRKVLELDPHSAQALNNLGMVYYLEHKYPEAEGALRKAVGIDPALTNGRVLLGSTLVREGKMEEATRELERAMKSRLTGSAEKTARMSLYEALFYRGDYAGALAALKPQAEKYPRDVDVWYDLGQAYLQLASQSLQRIAAIDPDSYRAHQIVADALAKQGRTHDAILEYRAVLKQKPDLPGVHYEIGLAMLMTPHAPEVEKEALQEFETELKINPYDAWTEYRMGKIYWKLHDAGQAAAHLRRALELDGSIVQARIVLARALESQGDLEAAEKQLEAAAKLDPDNPSVYYRLANIFKKLGQRAQADQAMKKFDEVQARRREDQQRLQRVIRMTAEPDTETPDEQEQ